MLYYETIEPVALELLKDLMGQKYLQQFMLTGGTALALQIGHRKSFDLDLFTTSDFNVDTLIPDLQKSYVLEPIFQMPQTLICKINDIKVDFIRFHYRFIRPIVKKDGIRILSIEDIAPMKLDAITGRGSKRDFYDLYFLLHRFDLNQLFSLYKEKYPHQTTFHVMRSLTYFVDAESDTNPVMINSKVTWEKVKKTITETVRKM